MRGPHDHAARTDVGRRREHNEDSVLDAPPLFAVADGVGGAAKGEVASRIAIESLDRALDQFDVHSSAEDRLRDAVMAANRAVYEAQVGDLERASMGTTMTAALMTAEDEVVIGHVGDSRAYLVTADAVRQLTDDHSLVGEMVRAGEISEDEAQTHPQRNVILRALGSDPVVEVDTRRIHVPAGGWLLLCSDGLTGHVTAPELRGAVLDGGGAEAVTQRLIDLANARGGSDNISVVVVQLTAPPDDGVIRTIQLAPDPLDDVPFEDRTRSPWAWFSGTTRTLILAAVVVIGLLVAGILVWEQSYYLTTRHGEVAADHGFPILGLHTGYRTSSIAASSLSQYDHARLLGNHTLRSRASVDATLAQLASSGANP